MIERENIDKNGDLNENILEKKYEPANRYPVAIYKKSIATSNQKTGFLNDILASP